MIAGSRVSAREGGGARATGRLGQKQSWATACGGLCAGWLAGLRGRWVAGVAGCRRTGVEGASADLKVLGSNKNKRE
jgi:hypothetical protein